MRLTNIRVKFYFLIQWKLATWDSWPHQIKMGSLLLNGVKSCTSNGFKGTFGNILQSVENINFLVPWRKDHVWILHMWGWNPSTSQASAFFNGISVNFLLTWGIFTFDPPPRDETWCSKMCPTGFISSWSSVSYKQQGCYRNCKSPAMRSIFHWSQHLS